VKGFNRSGSSAILIWMAIAVSCTMYAQTATRQTAMQLEQQGKNAEAEQVWHSIAKANPRNAEAFAHLGLLEARQEHYEAAITFYRKALSLNPEFPALQLNLGLALFKTGKFQEAIQCFQVELKKHAGDQRLNILLGMSHYAVGDYTGAIPYLKEASQRDSKNLSLQLTLAHSCLWTKQTQCVLDAYRQILLIDENSAEADMLAAEALDQDGDNAGATKLFREAVVANPKEPNVHFGLGYLLWTQSLYPEAAKEFWAELENDPTRGQARAYLGDSYLQLNEYAKAMAELEKAVLVEGSMSLVHLDLGILYADAKRNDEAERELLKAVELDPKSVAPHWRLAKLYQTMGKKDEAKAEFAKASSMNKEASQALHEKIAGAHSGAQEQPPTSPIPQ
jgi:tetratricopeptide (TPR) repeat protein